MSFVRTTDPVESHIAAASIQGTIENDRLIILEAFADLGKATYREAARRALKNTDPSVERLESLRRRGSDLKTLGFIEQIGRYNGQAEFKVTDNGKDLLESIGKSIW